MEKEDLYKKIIKSLDMNVAKNGKISIEDMVVKVNKKPLALETEYTDIDEVTLFDPMDEDLTKTDPGLKKLLRVLNLKTNALVFELLRLLVDENDKIELPSYLHILLAGVEEECMPKKGRKPKHFITDTTRKAVRKLEEYVSENDKFFMKALIKNPVDDKGEKFLSGIVVSSPLMEEFEEEGSDIYDCFNKELDSHVVLTLIKGIYSYVGLDGINSVSNADYSALVSYMKFFLSWEEVINGMIANINVEDDALIDAFGVKARFNTKDIGSLASIGKEKVAKRKPDSDEELDPWGYPVKKQNDDEFDRYGFDRYGFDIDGYDVDGYDVDGYRKERSSRRNHREERPRPRSRGGRDDRPRSRGGRDDRDDHYYRDDRDDRDYRDRDDRYYRDERDDVPWDDNNARGFVST